MFWIFIFLSCSLFCNCAFSINAPADVSVRLVGSKAIKNLRRVLNPLTRERLYWSTRINVLQADLRTLGIVNFRLVNSHRRFMDLLPDLQNTVGVCK